MFGDRGDSGRMAEGAEMIPDLDIYRSANLLVKRHGEDTPTVPGPISVT